MRNDGIGGTYQGRDEAGFLRANHPSGPCDGDKEGSWSAGGEEGGFHVLGQGTHRGEGGILVQPGVEVREELKWEAHFCLVP